MEFTIHMVLGVRNRSREQIPLHTKLKGRHKLTNTGYYDGAWQDVPRAQA